jgi:hypothetical protein
MMTVANGAESIDDRRVYLLRELAARARDCRASLEEVTSWATELHEAGELATIDTEYWTALDEGAAALSALAHNANCCAVSLMIPVEPEPDGAS